MKSEKHLAFIRSLPCLVCGDDTGSDACHIRYSDASIGKVNPGISAKPGDEYTVPMCRTHHEQQHKGSEKRFWEGIGLDPVSVALRLFKLTGDHARACKVIQEAQHD